MRKVTGSDPLPASRLRELFPKQVISTDDGSAGIMSAGCFIFELSSLVFTIDTRSVFAGLDRNILHTIETAGFTEGDVLF